MSPERRLANFTLGFLGIYAPLETWFSWRYGGTYGLLDPFYLVDFIGIVLLSWGAIRSRRMHETPGVLAAGWAWSGANFWRAMWGRVHAVSSGGQLDLGSAEMCVVICGTGIALICLAVALRLCIRPAGNRGTTGA